MSCTAASYIKAVEIANRLRAIYSRDGWKVEIVRPLYRGDLYHINVR